MKGKIFIESVFNGVVEGTITQFREIMKPQPAQQVFESCPMCGILFDDADFDFQICHKCGFNGNEIENFDFPTPRYKAGETVYLKEPYQYCNLQNICYKYDTEECQRPYCNKKDWKNKCTMPAKYARYFIKITDVRCERLQDISDEDCLKEGIIEADCICEDVGYVYENRLNISNKPNGTLIVQYNTPREAYAALIDKINGIGIWESNPYTWVYKFELTDKQ